MAARGHSMHKCVIIVESIIAVNYTLTCTRTRTSTDLPFPVQRRAYHHGGHDHALPPSDDA